MAWFAVASGHHEWMVVDTDREADHRVVASGMSWLDAETWCAMHAKHAGEYDDTATTIDRAEPFS